eukprot:217250_1
MGAACDTTKTSNCCGYREYHMQMMLNRDYPERATIQKNRRLNEKARSKSPSMPAPCVPAKPLVNNYTNFAFEDIKINQIEKELFEEEQQQQEGECEYEHKMIEINVIENKLFQKFDLKSNYIIFGYIHEMEHILNENNMINQIEIPNNIHYNILLYYYLVESQFAKESLILWDQRADISEFMCTTLQSTRTRMWDKFDKKQTGILSTQKYLPKFIYTISVLHMKSKQRKSIPPKYSKVKDCTTYMSNLLIETLPMDQRKYIDQKHFVDNIHIYLSSIC